MIPLNYPHRLPAHGSQPRLNGATSMRALIRILGPAFHAFLALLIVLWPVLCCCNFGHKARSCCESSAMADSDADHCNDRTADPSSDHHEHGHNPQPTGDSDHGTHGKRIGHSEDGKGGCGCQKSASTLAQIDSGNQTAVASASTCALAPVLGWLMQPIDRVVAPFGLDVERPPPMSLRKLRVLRI